MNDFFLSFLRIIKKKKKLLSQCPKVLLNIDCVINDF